ncbi:MAG TPA: hypothetical protein VL996_01540, partial [Methylocella sp.]|nr:hypothetical protein [Methylocella sp.]
MGLFGKLFSKKTDPELERFAKSIEDELAEIRRPKGPQGLAKSAIKGAESRRLLFELLKDFETETGRSGVSIVDTVESRGRMFVDRQLFEWFRKQRWNSSDSEPFLCTWLAFAFLTPDERRKTNEIWPSVVTTYHGKPNTEDILQEKADKLAKYIICNLGVATNLCSSFVEVSPDEFKDCHKIDDKLEELVRLEESALWLRTIDELAYMSIHGQRELFMDYLDDAFGYYLALRGTPPDAACRIIGERLTQYSSYQK